VRLGKQCRDRAVFITGQDSDGRSCKFYRSVPEEDDVRALEGRGRGAWSVTRGDLRLCCRAKFSRNDRPEPCTGPVTPKQDNRAPRAKPYGAGNSDKTHPAKPLMMQEGD
jgi:hypothetical protein